MSALRLARDLLAIDVGNSKLAASLLLSGKEAGYWQLSFDSLREQQWLGLWSAVVATLRGMAGREVETLIASVAPERSRLVERRLRRAGFARLHVASWRDPWPFEIDIEEPSGLGVDRLANVAGLRALGARSGVVVDAGTAITMDVLRRGVFVGGLILPGFKLAALALHEYTQQLPLVETVSAPALIGRHTRAALQAGIQHGIQGGVLALTRDLMRSLDAGAMLVFTGGLAEHLAAGPRARQRPDLQMLGLRALAARLR